MKKLLSVLVSALMIFTSGTVVMASNQSITECDSYEGIVNTITNNESTTIQLTKNVNLDDTVKIEEGKDVTIDLNGYTIFLDANDASTGRYAFDNSGSLTLMDSSESHKGTVNSRGIFNRNKFTAENITMIASGTDGGAVLWIYDNSVTNVKNCNVVTESGASGIRSDTSSKEETIINIEGTTINSAVHGVIASGSNTKISISNSTVKAGGIALAANNGGVLETNEAEIIGMNTYGAKNFMTVKTEDELSSIILNGGSIQSYNGSGCIEASSGKVEATNVAAYVDEKSNYLATAFSASNGGTLTLNNCSSNSKGYGIYVFNSGATINVNGGNYQAEENVIQIDDSTETDPSIVQINDGSFDGSIKIGEKSAENFGIQNGIFTSNKIQDYVKGNQTLLSLQSKDTLNYYVGESKTVSEKLLNNVKEGDEIVVLNGDIDLSINLDNVKITNQGNGTLIVNGEETNEVVTKHVHVYGDPSFTWNEDYSKAEAVFTCNTDNDKKIIEAAVTSTTVKPTAGKEGTITYTAKVTFEGKEYTDTKVVVLDKLPPVIISGNNAKWYMNSSEGLSFTSNAEYNDFVKVLVNDKEVESKYYTVKEGSTIVTLQPSFLGTLKEGTYKLAIVSTTGSAETQFTIVKASTVQPGEQPDTATENSKEENTVDTGVNDPAGIFAFAALLALGGAAAFALKKENN